MSRAATWLLTVGAAMFVALLAWQGWGGVIATLSRAGWGLLVVALFHGWPLMIDAGAIVVLFEAPFTRRSAADGLLTRWVGESANSLLPAGQLGGPIVMARHLASRGMPMDRAAAAITVSTTLQSFAQILFALVGVALLGAHAGPLSAQALRFSALLASGFLAVLVGAFFWLQWRGIFGKLVRAVNRFSSKRDWSVLITQAHAIDVQVRASYARRGRVASCLLLNLLGWFAGVGEVYLITQFLGMPVSWRDALLLESVGQAIRGAGFAIPGALGVQEGGYLLLATFIGLPPSAGIALSLAKRTRELLLGIPGVLYLRFSARRASRGIV